MAAPMKVSCASVKAFVSNNIIYVLGANGKNNRSKVECYDPATNSWFTKTWFSSSNTIDFTKITLAVTD